MEVSWLFVIGLCKYKMCFIFLFLDKIIEGIVKEKQHYCTLEG